MINMLSNQAEAYSRESFECGNCGQQFEAKVITWIDISKTPQAKQALLKWQFNIISALIAGADIFPVLLFSSKTLKRDCSLLCSPAIPDKRGEVEKSIREKYGYYPLLEFFYDMAQIWMLLYFTGALQDEQESPQAFPNRRRRKAHSNHSAVSEAKPPDD